MAVQNLICFDDTAKTLPEDELERQQTQASLQDNVENIIENGVENNNNNVLVNNLNNENNLQPKDGNSGGQGLLQLSENHFNNVLVQKNCLPEFGLARPDPTKKHVGVFWDIQNCCISQSQVSNVVQNIRDLYTDLDAIEGEFAVVCDVFGVNQQVLAALNNLQANIFHVCSYSKNACDEKLKQLIYRFVALYDKSSIIILISSMFFSIFF